MEHTIQVNQAIKELFKQHKVFVQGDLKFDCFAGSLHFDDHLRIEPHVELALTEGELWSMGTSSYMNASIFPVDTTVGRFCSIADQVGVLPVGHPLDRFSSSPITYIDETRFKGGSDSYRFGFSPLSNGAEKSQGFQMNIWDDDRLPILIGNDVWIASGVLIKPGVHIGDGAVVGIGSIVTHDVAPYTVVAGTPAVVRKQRFSDEIIERLERLQWWKYPYWKFVGVRGDMPIEPFIDQMENLLFSGRLEPYKPEALTAQMLLEAAD